MFKRPAWATATDKGTLSTSAAARATSSFIVPDLTSPGDGNQALEQQPSSSDSLFRHAARTHDARVAELAARRRREPKTEKSRRSRAGRKSGEKQKIDTDLKDDGVRSDGADEQETATTPTANRTEKGTGWTPSSLKKRRIDADDVKALLSKAGIKPIDSGDEGDVGRIDTQVPVQGRAHFIGDAITIEDDDRDEENEVEVQNVRPLTETAVGPEEDDESDPDLLELRRRARERHKQAKGRSATPVAGPASASTPNPAHDPDPIVHILITSPIPGTNPLIVQRKLSQRLQEVRLAWCRKQGFADDIASKVFLTFRGRRKYDVTAVKSLGLEVDALGTVTMRNGDFGEEVDRVHLEAMTDETLAAQKKESERALRQDVEGDASLAEAEEGSQGQQQLIRLLIKAKGQKDFKLRVKPDTIISKIVNAARREFQVPNGSASSYLEFDGERLNPQDHVQDTEIEDMMCLDFYAS